MARLTVEVLRRLFAALDARLQLSPSWRGADLERLLDHDHSTVVEAVAKRLETAGWQAVLEVTYSEFGERGSIDVLGLRPMTRAALVIEVKTDLPSSEAVARKLDEKARLVAGIVEQREGWRPETIGVLLVLPESPRLRRLLEASPVLARLYPIASRAVGSWLRQPSGAFRATWFLTNSAGSNRRRVRSPAGPSRQAIAESRSASLSVPNVPEADTDPIRTVLR